jgi:cytochrome c oxidase subunit 2
MAEGKRPLSAVFLVAFFGLLAILSLVFFLVGWRTPVASREGVGIDGIISYLLVVTGIIMLVGHGVLCWFIWKSSAGAAAAHGRPSRRAEWLWSLIPVLAMLVLSEAGVLAMGTPVWASLYTERPKDPVVIEVVGKQFEWFVRYPGKDGEFGEFDLKEVHSVDNPLGILEDDPKAQDDIIKRGTIYLPVDRPVVVRLRTQDVIHSFFVPQFRVKQDLLPGHQTRVKFTPIRTGEFELACAELCGLGHYTMRGTVHVREPHEFEEWLSKQFTFGG